MNKGLVMVFTGDGKGKTTAALGTALRMTGHGKRVGMVQFFKRPTVNDQRSTKKQSLSVARCPLNRQAAAIEAEVLMNFGPRCRVWSFGGGFTWNTSRVINQKAADQAWKKCRVLLRDPKCALVIFDEIHIALECKFLKITEVLKALKKRPAGQHVVLTGRGAPPALIRFADLVTEMKCIKHPFKRGILAQPGVDF